MSSDSYGKASIEGCGHAQNIEAGTQDKDNRVIPIVDATMNMMHM